MGLESVRNVVLVLSGKGGVGKSSVTVQLALALAQQGHNVGILDIDLTGPSIPRLLNLEDKKVTQAPGGWLPVQVHPAHTSMSPPANDNSTSARIDTQHSEAAANGHLSTNTQPSQPTANRSSSSPIGSLHALSLAFLLPSRSSAVIWRGPKKTAMIRQFLADVLWPPHTDFLLIDTPPGTSDEHIAVAEELHKLCVGTSNPPPNSVAERAPPVLRGAVVVTTPQAISTADVRKELNFCIKTAIPVLGVVENMAGYACPCCGEVSNIFSKGGGEIMARECRVPFLGSVPVDTGFGALMEGGGEVEGAEEQGEEERGGGSQGRRLLVDRYRECALCPIFTRFAQRIADGDRQDASDVT